MIDYAVQMIANILTDLNSAINFCLALTFGVISLWLWFHDEGKLRWLDLAESLIGLYFAGIYIFVLLASARTYDPVIFGQVFIRPALMVLFGVSAAGSIIRMKTRRCHDC